MAFVLDNFDILEMQNRIEEEESWAYPFRKQHEVAKASSSEELETIQEQDDDEFQYCCQVEKQSKSGLLFNKRVISLDQEYFCYYSRVQVSPNKRINLKHKPKVRIFIKDIASISIPADKSNCIRISGSGNVFHKGKTISKNENFDYIFRFPNQQMPILWHDMVLAAKEQIKSKSYLMTFEDLLKHSRSGSS